MSYIHVRKFECISVIDRNRDKRSVITGLDDRVETEGHSVKIFTSLDIRFFI